MTVSPPPYVYPDQSDELPAYSNSIHLVTLCRRKLEYTAPNVPARKGTRAWDFYWLVLSGTALNLYKPKRSELKAHIKCEADTRAARLKEHKRATAARKKSDSASSSSRSTAPQPPNGLCAHPNESVSSSVSFTRTITHHTPSSSPPPPPPSPSPSSSSPSSPPAVYKLPFDSTQESLDEASEPAPPLVIGGKPLHASGAGPGARTHALVQQYALTGATCVRPHDYLRRYFVLRICADGQQFMVQLNSHPETLEWLAAFSIAACLCLDLDERPMVEPPAYPRRRRHPSDLFTDARLENSNSQRAEILDSNEAAQLFLARSTTIRMNI